MRLIDADALAYEILSEYGADGGTGDVNTIYGMVINAPTIEPKTKYVARVEIDAEEIVKRIMAEYDIDDEPVKHGKWEEKETHLNEGDCEITEWQSARCSKCGKYHTTPYMYSFNNFNFCPNCGAKMSKGGGNECR